MSKSTCQSRLPTPSSIPATPELDLPMENNADNRRTSSFSDKRIHNVNYVRHVLRRFFGSHHKKSSSSTATAFDENSSEQSPTGDFLPENGSSPILIHPSLQYDQHKKFTGNSICESSGIVQMEFLGELLLDWFLVYFEGRCENLAFIRQILIKCCTCLLSLGVLRMENDSTNDLFQVRSSSHCHPLSLSLESNYESMNGSLREIYTIRREHIGVKNLVIE